MRLYRIIGHAWAGTQAEARAAAKEHNAPWHECDVPTDKPTLLAWLHERNVAGNEPVEPCNTPLLVADAPTDGDFFRLGPPTKNPPRAAPAFLGDLEAGAEFVPVTKAAEIDRLLGRCPACHNSADAARQRITAGEIDAIREWIGTAATGAQLDDLADLIEERRK